ncbi:RNA polymerase sigma factor [Myroides ceti]|uniref:RNA polymerase sigma factor n=1 Tax=Paenimyroides ceti TaxID=395087 RepID=A0ABT8CYW2_9FLAO|nr:RNA polymerase sigma factor [Paenimyroides ceti]MDN3708762.1 RNA polymerase sigma factor [Paenimyroides ceti]MDN3709337.1 RNA polymerase sigma factor [Paenimyroides ceti]
MIKLTLSTKDSRFFSVLYDRYAPYVYNKCFSFVDTKEEAQDLTHDIFIKVYLSLKTFKNESKFSTWLYSITYNFCVNFISKKKIKYNLDIDQLGHIQDEGEENGTEEDFDILQINYAKLQEILRMLDVQDRIILLMKYQDDLSIKEISELLKIGVSAVKMRLQRSKQKVMKKYKSL